MNGPNIQDEDAHVKARLDYWLGLMRRYWLRAADEITACDFAHTYLERALRGMEWPPRCAEKLIDALGTLQARMLVLQGKTGEKEEAT